jgi:hypothetical protein
LYSGKDFSAHPVDFNNYVFLCLEETEKGKRGIDKLRAEKLSSKLKICWQTTNSKIKQAFM